MLVHEQCLAIAMTLCFTLLCPIYIGMSLILPSSLQQTQDLVHICTFCNMTYVADHVKRLKLPYVAITKLYGLLMASVEGFRCPYVTMAALYSNLMASAEVFGWPYVAILMASVEVFGWPSVAVAELFSILMASEVIGQSYVAIAKLYGILTASIEVFGWPYVAIAELYGILTPSLEVFGSPYSVVIVNVFCILKALCEILRDDIANVLGICFQMCELPLFVTGTCITIMSTHTGLGLTYAVIHNMAKEMWYGSKSTCACIGNRKQVGGYKPQAITFGDIKDYIAGDVSAELSSCRFQFIDHVDAPNTSLYLSKQYIQTLLPLHILVSLVPLTICRKIATVHGMIAGSHTTLKMMKSLFNGHTCEKCSSHLTIFAVEPSQREHKKTQRKQAESIMTLEQKTKKREQARVRKAELRKQRKISDSEQDLDPIFPPVPLDKFSSLEIINGACEKMDPKSFEEAGCAVCGQLTLVSELSRLSAVKNHLNLLEAPGVTRKERFRMSEDVQEYSTAIDHTCKHICNSCRSSLRAGQVPKFALANDLWLGPVPEILSSLRYFEKMLIARIRHSCCSIKIASGMRKMKAHAISYQQPIPKVYNILPPPKEEIEEVIAIMFTGPSKPTPADYQRTPFLVRRNKVKLALEWLILNHSDYEDVSISNENLDQYPEDTPPVSVEYKPMTHNKTPEGTSVHDMDEEDGTEEGECAFTVHGLTGEQLNVMTANAVKAKALQHLNSSAKFLAIGHDEQPESIWHNPQLYPQMFPWLFPYGLGGVGSPTGITEKGHKKWLLMYHDKRFQLDQDFPFIAFSHEQIKTTSTQSFLLADKKIFGDIKDRILNIDQSTLSSLLERMNKDEIVKAQTVQEEQCFQLLKDLDHVAGPVKGSNTSKKWMRNEIWSLIYLRGAPFWYITISPADIKHPLCIYYSNKGNDFVAEILPYDKRLRLICQNPVAGARFFDFMVKLFITEILGIDVKHKGIYGDVTAYYGTVEQQGRLTLHLHMLIWLLGNLTPQEMRDRVVDPNSTFRKRLVLWLESCHIGEFMTGSKDEVVARVSEQAKYDTYRDPTETLPEPAPPPCDMLHATTQCCSECAKWDEWWTNFQYTVDDLISKSNIHNCERGTNRDGSLSKKYASCKDNKYGKCKARFPREMFNSTEVDLETGSLNMKKHEPWMNFVTPALTYILRCNTDVTCLRSGTALKAVIMYVTDYITKTGLKTHVIFEAIRSVFDKHHEILSDSISEKEKARKLMNKIVNALSVKLEMGGPMVCMYLLGNPDHYTNHTFISFYWYSFVVQAQKAWEKSDIEQPQKVTLIRTNNKIIGISPVHDYIYRPSELNHMNLYDWALQCKRQKLRQNSHTKKKAPNPMSYGLDDNNGDDDNSSDDTDSDSMLHKDGNESSEETITNESLSDLPRNTYRYLHQHPLFDTHVAIFKKCKPNVAINFIGRTLPRCDQGDREFYCLTMLAFFKPWRSGLDLKSEDKSWDEMFCEHHFTKQQQDLMKNFNIRYECSDARDDFRAQRTAGGLSNEWTMNDLDIHEDDDNFDLESDPYTSQGTSGALDEPDMETSSNSEKKRQKEAAEIRDVLRRTGWLDPTPPATSTFQFNHFIPEVHWSAAVWKSILQTKKANTIENKSLNLRSAKPSVKPFTPNMVKVIDKAYLEQKNYTSKHNTSIDRICKDYGLNEEQERAFRIVANHVVLPNSAPLKMYIGGMGGTGKSRVLNAISTFFKERNEAHRFIIVAPTGTAAALLSGSTYHSVFGINDMSNGTQSYKTLSQVRTRLQGVDYIFLDEVSMLSCYDLYRISAQLCKVMNNPTSPFGGYNILFAGDFAQLPPPVGGENVSLYSRVIGISGTTTRAQEEALGRALWHQVTMVVILRRNMRQTTQSKNDNKLRTALENMRYKDCTPNDIQFLRTRISSPVPGRPSITAAEFKYVSIITAKNAQKDEINRLGCEKFAHETGQELVDFYSDDALKSIQSKEKTVKQYKKRRSTTQLNIKTQKKLWNLPHSSADKPVPGKLSLCPGLPVMIKSNVATELCITNGQEGTVLGWHATTGQHNQQILDVLFIKLKSPPKTIQISGLPENTVPLTRSTVAITCHLADDTKVSITQSQVEVLPNFAMTDFASQGKTRPYNPVDLNNCRSHQAYYTALS